FNGPLDDYLVSLADGDLVPLVGDEHVIFDGGFLAVPLNGCVLPLASKGFEILLGGLVPGVVTGEQARSQQDANHHAHQSPALHGKTPSAKDGCLDTPDSAKSEPNDFLSSGGRAESLDTTKNQVAAAVCWSTGFGQPSQNRQPSSRVSATAMSRMPV